MSSIQTFDINAIRWQFRDSSNPSLGLQDEESGQSALRASQVTLWDKRSHSLSTFKHVSTITTLCSFILTYYAKKHNETRDLRIFSLLSLISALSRYISSRASSRAEQQSKAWLISPESWAISRQYWEMMGQNNKTGMSHRQYVNVILDQLERNSPSQDERASKLALLLNFFKTRIWKEGT
jgi:hypothetical protein